MDKSVFAARTVTVNDKTFIQQENKITCASCLFVQQTRFANAVRDSRGIITGWRLEPKDEQHADDCSQK